MSERNVMPNDPFKKARTPFQALTTLETTTPKEAESVTDPNEQKVADTSKTTDNSKKNTKKPKKSTAPKETTAHNPEPTPEKPKREKVGFYWEHDLHEEARSCAHHVSEFVNISHFSEEAARTLIKVMRDKHNNGKPFPPLPPEVKARLRGGRPAGS